MARGQGMAGRGGMARQNTRIRPGWPCRHGPAACAWPRARNATRHATGRRQRKAARACGWPVQSKARKPCPAPGPPRFGGWSCDRFTRSQPCGWGRMGGSRTRDTRVISTLLYPTELPVEACPESNRTRRLAPNGPCRVRRPRRAAYRRCDTRGERIGLIGFIVPSGRLPAPAGRALRPNPGLQAIGACA